jgi:hypothetical protein
MARLQSFRYGGAPEEKREFGTFAPVADEVETYCNVEIPNYKATDTLSTKM